MPTCSGCKQEKDLKDVVGNVCGEYCNRVYCKECAPSYLQVNACSICYRWSCYKCVKDVQQCTQCKGYICCPCSEAGNGDECDGCTKIFCMACIRKDGHYHLEKRIQGTYCRECFKDPLIEKECCNKKKKKKD